MVKITRRYLKKDGALVEYVYSYPQGHYYRKKKDEPDYISPLVKLDSPNSNVVKRFIRDRDKVCQNCGATTRLDVHHKDGNGVNSKNPNQTTNNLILLCHKCHIRIHLGISDKHTEIIKRRLHGETYQSIANSYNVSRQRIYQIIQENLP